MLSVTTPTWCVVTFAAGLIEELGGKEISFGVPPAWGFGAPSFGHYYTVNKPNEYVVRGNVETNKWEVNLRAFGEQ